MKTSPVSTIGTKVKTAANRFQYFMVAAAMVVSNLCPTFAWAQDSHSHGEQHEMSAEQRSQANQLIKIVRESTERFKNVAAAEAEGYALQFGCVSGDYSAAMGLHYVNGDLVNKGVLDATRPQIVIYEATPNGGRKLIGADYLLFADAWNAKHSSPPQLMGQLFHLFEKPNRFGLDSFYTLHVWAWKDNPQGAFVNWHPNVSCENYTGQTQ